MTKSKKAAIIIIGNEILSGRTLDINTQFIAQNLAEIGIILGETRVIRDDQETIIEAVRSYKDKFDYVFTTGGIGPTHDDITAESVSLAVGQTHQRNESIYQMICNHYQNNMNKAREKMSYMPEKAFGLINENKFFGGFRVENIFVFPGIPDQMQRSFAQIKDNLLKGKPVISKECRIYAGETFIAEELTEIQKNFLEVEIGSYPFREDESYGAAIILRGDDEKNLEICYREVSKLAEKYNKGKV